MSDGTAAPHALTEGDVDRVVVEKWLEGSGYVVLPRREATRKGKDAVVQNAHALLTQGMSRVILAIDLNGGTKEDLRAFVLKGLRSLTEVPDRVVQDGDAVTLGEGHAVLLPVGLLTIHG